MILPIFFTDILVNAFSFTSKKTFLLRLRFQILATCQWIFAVGFKQFLTLRSLSVYRIQHSAIIIIIVDVIDFSVLANSILTHDSAELWLA